MPEPLKLGTVSLTQPKTSLSRVIDNIPRYYFDSQVMKELLNSVLREQDLIAHFFSTPDESP